MSNLEVSSKARLDSIDVPTSTRWRSLARRGWIVIVAGMLATFVAGLAVGFGQLREVCTSSNSLCHPMQLSLVESAINQHQLQLSLDFYAAFITISFAIFASIYVAVGMLIFWRKSDDWMALAVAYFLVMVGLSAVPVIPALEAVHPQFFVAQQFAFLTGVQLLPIMVLIFPDGRFILHWTRWLALIFLIYLIHVNIENDVARSGILSGPPSPLGLLLFITGGLSQVYRYRTTSDPLRRQQARWVMFGFVGHITCLSLLVFILNLFPVLTRPGAPNLLFDRYAFSFIGLVPILFIPMSFAVAILRYHLWDIEIIINRTLVYTILSALVIGIYTVIVGSLGALFQTGDNLAWSLVATGIVAVSFHTLREMIQRSINRLMFGDRDEPYAVLERLSRQLEPVMVADEILPTIVETIANALRLPYAAIALRHQDQYQIVARNITSDDDTLHDSAQTFPLVYQSEIIGQLLLAPRGHGETFSSADLKLLETIARQTSIAAYNVHLTTDLQRSREELVTAREEERRRLRRDLHDGLGPVLASMSFRLDAIYNLADDDPQKAKATAAALKDQVQTSLSEIRRIAYNLRPPALDELGLIGALREHLVSVDGAGSLQVVFDAPETLPMLPAAVEVAAYRIAMEAVTNVQRHANASLCSIRLGIDRNLCLEIVDNGRGIPDHYRTGVGLTAMRERASELGGQCRIESRPDSGTRVYAILPVMREK